MRRSLILMSSRLAELLAECELSEVKTQRELVQWRTDSVVHVRLQPLDESKRGFSTSMNYVSFSSHW